MSYYIDAFTLNKCLSKVKGNDSLEDFKSKFYRQLKLNGGYYTDNQYDLLLESLYKKSEPTYHECYSNMYKMSLKYARENQELIASLIDSNNIDLIQVAYDMYKRVGSILSRFIPTRVNKQTVKEADKELLNELKDILNKAKTETDEDILTKSKQEFAKYYGQYENNEYLGEYYNSLVASIEQTFLKLVNNEIAKVCNLKGILRENAIDSASFDDRQMFEKAKKNDKTRINMYKQKYR